MSIVGIPRTDAVMGPIVEPHGMVFFEEKCCNSMLRALAARRRGSSASIVVA